MNNTQTNTFKVILTGSGGCGKTTFVKRHLTGEFEPRYLPTTGMDWSALVFNTNYGPITLSIWDCAGQEQFKGLGEGYYIDTDAVIIMFDVTSQKSYEFAEREGRNIKENFLNPYEPQIPFVVCGNKCDKQVRKVKSRNITLHRLLACNYFDISVKTNYNFEKPFLTLIRHLMHHDDLTFIDGEPIQVPKSLH